MKTVEKNCTKSGRIIAKAKFSNWVFLSDFIIAVVLGAIVAVLWIFNDQIEAIFTKQAQPAQVLTEGVLRWVLLGVACFVLLVFAIHLIVHTSKELVMTEDQIVYRKGFFHVQVVAIPLSKIVIVEAHKNFLQRILGYGTLVIISDAENPYVVKHIRLVETFARRVMRQINLVNQAKNRNLNIRFTGATVAHR